MNRQLFHTFQRALHWVDPLQWYDLVMKRDIKVSYIKNGSVKIDLDILDSAAVSYFPTCSPLGRIFKEYDLVMKRDIKVYQKWFREH